MINKEKTINSNPLIGLNRATNIDRLKAPEFRVSPIMNFRCDAVN